VTVALLNPDELVHPGMTAALSIIINQLDDVLLIPNRAVRTVDNQRVVYVLRNNLPVSVPVEIGVSSDTFSELVGDDLKEGDLIILNPPSMVMQNFGF
jgi:HlyD family secretion protein